MLCVFAGAFCVGVVCGVTHMGMAMPRVSVLMPVYNTDEEFLRPAIESILGQTYQDFEFVILNDGSTNNAASVIHEYVIRDNRIRFINNPNNRGVGVGRNVLLDAACGEFIAYNDSDDISYPHRLETQVKFLDSNPDITVVGCAMKTIPSNRVITCPPNPKILDFYIANMVANPSVMFRRADINCANIRYNPEYTTAEDYDFWAHVARCFNIQNLSDVLVMYREQETSLSHNNPQMFHNNRIIQSKILDYLTDCPQLRLFLAPSHRVYVFGFLPVLKIKRTRIYLFDVLPLFKLRGKWWCLFDVIPMYKRGK